MSYSCSRSDRRSARSSPLTDEVSRVFYRPRVKRNYLHAAESCRVQDSCNALCPILALKRCAEILGEDSVPECRDTSSARADSSSVGARAVAATPRVA